MRRRRSDVGVPRRPTMVDMDVMYDDMRDILQRQTPVPGDMNVGPPTVDGLVRVEDELVLELDDHVCRENDPQRLVLDDGVSERARFGVDGVVVGRVGDGVDPAAFTAERASGEAD
ncbi:hypothetical protein F3Y22_tig00111069pilonHSYRG00030 [Hibiscus syriacus]|uniref:Uncharacterized protein n=1 Tax=Hibiscus syriacus TaxID=106335 RepID=A0A6A2Z2Y0_HIBSY|nr:hypothetical protein F3Y22_tig00111069pilonHSYRG00030 [Hibiscus syriacus]